jgi:hypothetical protein
VPWLEGYTVQGRDAQQLWHQQRLKQGLPPPGLGGYDDVRPEKRVIVDVVKLKRLDVRTV